MRLHSWIDKLLKRTPRSALGKGGHRRAAPRRQHSVKLWLETLEDRLAPANIVVLNNHDAGAGSLRQAIMDSAAGGSISFASSLAGAIITLTKVSGPLGIFRNLTINGLGADQLTVSGGAVTAAFLIPNATVAINGLQTT